LSRIDAQTESHIDQPRSDGPPSGRPDASVVVCAYTEARWDALDAAVQALAHQTLPPGEVIVVVDHNDALLVRAADALASARVLPNEERPGLSGARNTGVRHATGRIVAFLDDDALPDAAWLERLTAAFDDSAVVGAGGLATPEWVDGPRPRWLPPEMYWVVGCSYVGLPTEVAEIRNPIGANMAFRREALGDAGGFVEGIGRVGTVPLGCEETELAIRIRRMTGGVVLHLPAARVSHRVTASRVTWRYFLSRCWSEGLSKALVARHAGAQAALASERAYALRTLPRGVARGVRDAIRGDTAGLARAAAIVTGLVVTTAGYLRGRLGA
jgi:glycosyltransferase involved in cell wall biosynthesis